MDTPTLPTQFASNSIVVVTLDVHGHGSHQFLVKTDADGNASRAFRGGPEDQGKPYNVDLADKIGTREGYFNSSFIDHPDHLDLHQKKSTYEGSKVVQTYDSPEALNRAWEKIKETGEQINDMNIPYDLPYGFGSGKKYNSNSVVNTALDSVGIHPDIETGWLPKTPGAGNLIPTPNRVQQAKGIFVPYGKGNPFNPYDADHSIPDGNPDPENKYDPDNASNQPDGVADPANPLDPDNYLPNIPPYNYDPDRPEPSSPRGWPPLGFPFFNPPFIPSPARPPYEAPYTAGEGANGVQRRDPLFLDLDGDGDGVETLSIEQANHWFDLDANGFTEKSGWVAPVLDRDNDGTINNGTELFGDATALNEFATASTGFQALSALDANNDGVINASDPLFASLRVLKGDGTLHTLESLQIAQLNLQHSTVNITDAANNIQARLGSYVKTDGTSRAMGDYLLDRNTITTREQNPLPVYKQVA
jgi:hypothetical protein